MSTTCAPGSSVSNLAPTMLPALPVVEVARPHLPTSRAEMEARGWDEVDIVFSDGRRLYRPPEFCDRDSGPRFRSGLAFGWPILEPTRLARAANPGGSFGRPRLFFAISAETWISMINHYTANRKVRNDDAYSPGGKIGLRPDQATLPYCQRARSFSGRPGNRRRGRGLASETGALRLLE